jgi:hypothetical protein
MSHLLLQCGANGVDWELGSNKQVPRLQLESLAEYSLVWNGSKKGNRIGLTSSLL